VKQGASLLLTAAILTAVFSGCGSQESADDLFTRGEEATHRVQSYAAAEKALDEFLDRFSEDPRADIALQSLARVLLSQQRYKDAVVRYRRLADDYPDSRYRDQAQFMIGYVLDLSGDLDAARIAYQKVIDQYPESDLADDAELSIQNLGKTPEEWLAPRDKSSDAQ
jgi:outer membrane protein assembly factor BamD (BamD/ComL family)